MRLAAFLGGFFLLPIQAAASSSTVVREKISPLEHTLTELRDALLDKGSDLSARFQPTDGKRKLTDAAVVAPKVSVTRASMEQTLLHLTRALEQQGDKEARAASLQMAMANLQSFVVDSGSDDGAIMKGMENPYEKSKSNELTVSEDFVKESFASNVEIVKHGFKNVVAALHNALELDEETDYLGRRLLTYFDCHKQGQQSGSQPAVSDVDLYATTQESLVAMLNGLLGDRAPVPTQEDILNIVSVFMAFPANFAIEFGKFMLAWKLHHTTCLKNPESTAQMEATLFIDYMARVEKEQRAKQKAEDAAAAADETDVAAVTAEKESAVADMKAKKVEVVAAAKEAKQAEADLMQAEAAEKKAAAAAEEAEAAAKKAEDAAHR